MLQLHRLPKNSALKWNQQLTKISSFQVIQNDLPLVKLVFQTFIEAKNLLRRCGCYV